MARSLVDLSVLDEHIQALIAEFGDLKEFRSVVWRHEPDATGANWDARVEPLVGAVSFPDIVSGLRARFNLT